MQVSPRSPVPSRVAGDRPVQHLQGGCILCVPPAEAITGTARRPQNHCGLSMRNVYLFASGCLRRRCWPALAVAALSPAVNRLWGLYPTALFERLEFPQLAFRVGGPAFQPVQPRQTVMSLGVRSVNLNSPFKMSGHPPFGAQIILNGHEYVACRPHHDRIRFTKEGNCFTHISDAAGLARVADTLSTPPAIGRLNAVCERWVYEGIVF